jgi:hypothetical protein
MNLCHDQFVIVSRRPSTVALGTASRSKMESQRRSHETDRPRWSRRRAPAVDRVQRPLAHETKLVYVYIKMATSCRLGHEQVRPLVLHMGWQVQWGGWWCKADVQVGRGREVWVGRRDGDFFSPLG